MSKPSTVSPSISILFSPVRVGALPLANRIVMAPLTRSGKRYAFSPGSYSAEHIAQWRHVTAAVHACGGHIVLQLWHVGRISHPSLQPNGQVPVAP